MWSFLPLLEYTRSRDPEDEPFPRPPSVSAHMSMHTCQCTHVSSHVALTAQTDKGSQAGACAKQGPGGPQVRAPWTRRRFCWSPVPKAAAPGSLSPPTPGSLILHRQLTLPRFLCKHMLTLRLTKGTLSVPEWYPQSGPGPSLQMQIPGGWALFYAKQLLRCALTQRTWAFAICPLDLLSPLM